ncbi:diacylglycerol kinase [Celerinatantimonas sp. MCCC 1A17872]|uniref:diacylglycerol kinase n=1 Tax=Celerinatantimonas sp. MCCC 1A17872 TaxID=3177514 RepID=UPI0038C4FCA8
MSDTYTHKGIKRIVYATGYSIQGLKYAWREAAFRQEICCCLPLMILTGFLPISAVEQVLLVMSLTGILITEVINSAIEAVVDRIGTDWNEYSKMAKDLGSMAVLLAIFLAIFTWVTILIV